MNAISEDPRARRTRQSLLDALRELMRQNDFERISVADITEAAEVNRATFYAHFADKFALLEGLVTARFDAMLESRGVIFNGCSSALAATIHTLCDYLSEQPWATARDRARPHPYLEAATIAVVRRRMLGGMRRGESQPCDDCGRAELVASTAAWAIYGAAREWLARPERVCAGEIVPTIATLVEPILANAPWSVV